MAFIVVKDPDTDLWATNPSLELIDEFKKFKEKEGEERSGNIIKAIYFIWDPKSDVRDTGLTQEKLIEDISGNIIGDKNFDWDEYEDLRELYMEVNTTRLEKQFLRYEREINDLNDILEEWKWSKSNIKDRAEAVKQYKMLFDECITVREKVFVTRDEMIEMRGGYQLSLIEQLGSE